MEQDNVSSAVCYACFTPDQKAVSEKDMMEFMNRAIPFVNINITDLFVEHTGKKLTRNRPAWSAMLAECDVEDIHIVIVPSITMLSKNASDAVALIRECKRKHGIDFYFIYERIFTKTGDADLMLSFHCEVSEYLDEQAKYKKHLRDLFKKAAQDGMPLD